MAEEFQRSLDVEFQVLTEDVADLRDRLLTDGRGLLADVAGTAREQSRYIARDVEKFMSRAETIIERIEALLETLRSLRGAEATVQVRSTGLSIQAMINILEIQLEWLSEELARLQSMEVAGGAPSPPRGPTLLQRAWSWIKSVGALIKRISATLWQIIARLLTPKEWTLKGDIGTGFLGLANAGIEITFGP